MTARRPWEDGAGPWVAYRDEPRRVRNPETKRYDVPGETRRCYLYDHERGTGMLGDPAKCVRFDTKAEALEAARERWPMRVKGCRIGAERIES